MHPRHMSMLTMAALAILASPAAHSQGIQKVNEPYHQALPIAPASGGRLQIAARPAVAAAGFLLRGGESISAEMADWAARSGWEIYWRHRVSWRTIRDTAINKADVTDAVAEVVDILREEGKPIALRISSGNKVMEVLSMEVRNDGF